MAKQKTLGVGGSNVSPVRLSDDDLMRHRPDNDDCNDNDDDNDEDDGRRHCGQRCLTAKPPASPSSLARHKSFFRNEIPQIKFHKCENYSSHNPLRCCFVTSPTKNRTLANL